MLWDMGLPENLMDTPAAVKLKIEEAEQNFDLILISERFEYKIKLKTYPMYKVMIESPKLQKRKVIKLLWVEQAARKKVSTPLAAVIARMVDFKSIFEMFSLSERRHGHLRAAAVEPTAGLQNFLQAWEQVG